MRIYRLILAIILPFFVSSQVYADEWMLPVTEKYYSFDKSYFFKVTPRKLESPLKYFEDKEKRIEPAGSAVGSKDNFCKGELYKKGDDEMISPIWEIHLLNDVAPVDALVSNTGEFVVTFDNWHSMGYGDNIVVIYGRNGSVIRKFSLEDIFRKNDINNLPRSVSSVYWGRNHYIDDNKHLLVLKLVCNWNGDFKEEPEYRELRVDLKTGAIIGDKE